MNNTGMNTTGKDQVQNKKEASFSGFKIFLIVLIAIIIAVVATVFIIKSYVFPSEFSSVTLNAKEELILEEKLKSLNLPDLAPGSSKSLRESSANKKPSDFDSQGNLIPERYSEEGASREVSFSERELNALLAKNTDLADKLAIDLSDNLISAKLLIPLDEDFPVLGGKTLRVRAGLELAYNQAQKPVVELKGVSVMGVPLPGTWLGGFKNLDLVKEYGDDFDFWSSFAEGIEYIHVEEGRLKVKLKE